MREDSVAVITEVGVRYTYQQLEAEVKRVGANLQECSLAVILMKNDMDSIICYLACLSRKVVPILLNYGIHVGTVQMYLSKYQPQYVLLSSKLKFDSQNSFRTLVKVDSRWLLESRDRKPVKLHKDLCLLLTTSGTSGISKLVRISKENLLSNTKSICEYLGINESERAITTLPLSYTYGLSVLNTHLYSGATILLTSKSILQKSFWQFFEKYQATSLSGVPYTYELLEKKGFLHQNFPFLKCMTQAGGKLPVDLQLKFGGYACKHGINMVLMYGQTEATARISYLPPEDILKRPGSVGIAIPGGKIRIVPCQEMVQSGPITKQLNQVGKQEIGEIVYEGDNVSMGYAECLEDLEMGNQNRGLLYTGDTGYIKDGYLYITGRIARFAKIYGRRINLQALSEIIDREYQIKNYCYEYQNKIIVVCENAKKEQIQRLSEGLPDNTGLTAHCFIYKEVKESPRNFAGKHMGRMYETD